MALAVVDPQRAAEFFARFPVTSLWRFGKVTKPTKLALRLGVERTGRLRSLPIEQILPHFG